MGNSDEARPSPEWKKGGWKRKRSKPLAPEGLVEFIHAQTHSCSDSLALRPFRPTKFMFAYAHTHSCSYSWHLIHPRGVDQDSSTGSLAPGVLGCLERSASSWLWTR
eukprot:5355668-Pyramimonas_sp.AAC.1